MNLAGSDAAFGGARRLSAPDGHIFDSRQRARWNSNDQKHLTDLSALGKSSLRRFATGLTDSQIASELRDRLGRIAAQRQRLAEKFDTSTPEQLATVANELARHPS